MRTRTRVLLVILSSLASAVGGCARPEPPPFEVERRPAVLFDPSPENQTVATLVGRGDWPSAAGPIDGGGFGAYSVTIYDWQGGTNSGYGFGWGPWNNYQRIFRGYRVGGELYPPRR